MGLTNDERGWVMTCLSGVACVVGASVICVDVIIRQFPGKKNFRIQDSDTFLSLSLSLSFGVMLFSALYSMLPNSKKSLEKGGFTPKEAAWIMIACFLGGVIGIQFLSRFIHQFMPSHVVDCEHSHDEESPQESEHDHHHDQDQDHGHKQDVDATQPRTAASRPSKGRKSSLPGHMPTTSRKPSMRQTQSSYFSSGSNGLFAPTAETQAHLQSDANQGHQQSSGRPSLQARLTTGASQVTLGSTCDTDGPCHGYSDPCGQDCFKSVSAKGGTKLPPRANSSSGRLALKKNDASVRSNIPMSESTPLLQDITEEPLTKTKSSPPDHHPADDSDPNPSSTGTLADEEQQNHLDKTDTNTSNHDLHHHHVPTNAFLSIGLQTSLAIALHKLPEGFITYATNHANPTLGVSVFLALFIHNITEGFAMALPLYLAINSRAKAMAWSFVLGGLSQPVGAGVAAAWFKIAGKGDWAPSEGVYGGMFAVTAGIMASVALQLFSESLDLTHSRNLCMIGAFCGMGILGASSALTAS